MTLLAEVVGNPNYQFSIEKASRPVKQFYT